MMQIVSHEGEWNYKTKDAIDVIGRDTNTTSAFSWALEEGEDAGVLGDGKEDKEAAHEGILLYL